MSEFTLEELIAQQDEENKQLRKFSQQLRSIKSVLKEVAVDLAATSKGQPEEENFNLDTTIQLGSSTNIRFRLLKGNVSYNIQVASPTEKSEENERQYSVTLFTRMTPSAPSLALKTFTGLLPDYSHDVLKEAILGFVEMLSLNEGK